MKRIFTSAATLCALSFSLFAHPNSGQMDDQYQSSSSAPAQMTTPSKWQQNLIDKEGWIEGGAEWLYLSSSLNPTYTNEQLTMQNVNTANILINVSNTRLQRVNPEYNSGYTVFFRYRGGSDNDLSFQYHYLRNNGSGSLNRDDSFTTSAFDGVQIVDVDVNIRQNDKGHLHNHMHIFDLLAGRGLPLSHQMLFRLSGGLTVHDFFLFYQFNDDDIQTVVGPNINATEDFNAFFKERMRFWALGPKAQLAFDYLMLPSDWNHSLNFSLTAQYALLFSKRWSSGIDRRETRFEDFINPNSNFYSFVDDTFHIQPDHHLIHNLNLDFGMNYRWESSYADLIFNLAAGYRVYSFWNMYNLFATPALLGDQDDRIIQGIINDETMIYGGPYIRFSIAY